jgi:transcriptional regulator with XRE-family HTH domain
MIDKIVRDLRMGKGISSTALSEKVGMNNTWVSQIETGKIKLPHLPSLKNLLHILEVSQEDIEKIILDEFPEVDRHSTSHSSNKTDYKLERKLIRSRKKITDYGKKEFTIFTKDLLTDEEFQTKCNTDASYLFNELKKLPKLTLELLIISLIDEL